MVFRSQVHYVVQNAISINFKRLFLSSLIFVFSSLFCNGKMKFRMVQWLWKQITQTNKQRCRTFNDVSFAILSTFFKKKEEDEEKTFENNDYRILPCDRNNLMFLFSITYNVRDVFICILFTFKQCFSSIFIAKY